MVLTMRTYRLLVNVDCRIDHDSDLDKLAPAPAVSGIDGKAVVSFKIPARFGTEGRPMRDIPLPDGTMIPLLITREGDATIPGENTLIRAGDEILAVTTAQLEEDVRNLFTEENE